MSKKCTPLWREARFQVKMYKAPPVRTTFGSWDVEKVHAVVARSTFPSENDTKRLMLFDPPEPQIIGKTQCFATFLPFRAPGSSFFWDFLFCDLLSSSLLFSYSSHLCFSSVHIVGSLTSKLPSVMRTPLNNTYWMSLKAFLITFKLRYVATIRCHRPSQVFLVLHG